MTNNIAHRDDDDDGFSGSLVGDRLIKGVILRWNETADWIDRDGLRPPEPLLVLACSEALQRWKGKKPAETITAKPFPPLEDLNASVPANEWEPGLDGRPKAPWVHQVVVYLINPIDAGFYTYLNSTLGAHAAWDRLRERVTTMRLLRGTHVVPLVRLGRAPWKTAFGMKHRPEFEIVSWRTIGGGGTAIGGPTTPQLSAPATDKPKPEDEAAKTIGALEEVTLPSAAEEMADEIVW